MENDKRKTISASKPVFEKTEGDMVRERGFSPQACNRKQMGHREFDATHN